LLVPKLEPTSGKCPYEMAGLPATVCWPARSPHDSSRRGFNCTQFPTVWTEQDSRHDGSQHMSAAELLVKSLQNDGVDVVFGIHGEENIRTTMALSRSPIRYLLARDERAASFMAEMYARVSGRAGVISTTL